MNCVVLNRFSSVDSSNPQHIELIFFLNRCQCHQGHTKNVLNSDVYFYNEIKYSNDLSTIELDVRQIVTVLCV